MSVVQEAYVNGVSTRKVDRLVEQMRLRVLSKDQVSRMCRGCTVLPPDYEGASQLWMISATHSRGSRP